MELLATYNQVDLTNAPIKLKRRTEPVKEIDSSPKKFVFSELFNMTEEKAKTSFQSVYLQNIDVHKGRLNFP